jgi:phage terminase large subunit
MFRGEHKPTGAVVVRANWRDNPWRTAELDSEREDTLRMKPDQYENIWEGGYVKIVEGAYFASDLAQGQGRKAASASWPPTR